TRIKGRDRRGASGGVKQIGYDRAGVRIGGGDWSGGSEVSDKRNESGWIG
nr:hypothetical protein [Tanacetum cinerariifolium]